MSKNSEKIQKKLMAIAKRIKAKEADMRRELAVTAVNYSKQAFRQRGWDGQPWAKRKPGAPRESGRALLIDSGRLRNSIRYNIAGATISLRTDVPYAEIHNTGGITHPRVTDKMRGFAWAKYRATKQSKWKALALTKKNRLDVPIPQRKFIGDATALRRQLRAVTERHFKTILQ